MHAHPRPRSRDDRRAWPVERHGADRVQIPYGGSACGSRPRRRGDCDRSRRPGPRGSRQEGAGSSLGRRRTDAQRGGRNRSTAQGTPERASVGGRAILRDLSPLAWRRLVRGPFEAGTARDGSQRPSRREGSAAAGDERRPSSRAVDAAHGRLGRRADRRVLPGGGRDLPVDDPRREGTGPTRRNEARKVARRHRRCAAQGGIRTGCYKEERDEAPVYPSDRPRDGPDLPRGCAAGLCAGDRRELHRRCGPWERGRGREPRRHLQYGRPLLGVRHSRCPHGGDRLLMGITRPPGYWAFTTS